MQLPELVHRLHLHDKPDVTKHIVHHLPISLLMAGCNAVISHQWNVTDACSVLLVDHFFELLLAGQLPISRCLQQAQHFLRDLTMGQMRKIERTMRRAAVPITIILPSECQGRDRPFENAKFWGGYQLTEGLRRHLHRFERHDRTGVCTCTVLSESNDNRGGRIQSFPMSPLYNLDRTTPHVSHVLSASLAVA